MSASGFEQSKEALLPPTMSRTDTSTLDRNMKWKTFSAESHQVMQKENNPSSMSGSAKDNAKTQEEEQLPTSPNPLHYQNIGNAQSGSKESVTSSVQSSSKESSTESLQSKSTVETPSGLPKPDEINEFYYQLPSEDDDRHRSVSINSSQLSQKKSFNIHSACSKDCCSFVVESICCLIPSALPSAINAAAGASHSVPADMKHSWWEKLSDYEKCSTFNNGTASFIVNCCMASVFLGPAFYKFKESTQSCLSINCGCNANCSDRCLESTSYCCTTGIACTAALASGMIALNACGWLTPCLTASSCCVGAAPAIGEGIKFFVAGVSGFAHFATRYKGIIDLFKKVSDFFNEDAKLQAEVFDALGFLEEKNMQRFHQLLNKKSGQEKSLAELIEIFKKEKRIHVKNELTKKIENKLITILEDLNKEVCEKDSKPAFREETKNEMVLRYARYLSSGILTAGILISGVTWDQKFIDGMSFLGLAPENLDLQKILGILPGLTSVCLYTDAAIHLIPISIDVAKYLSESFKDEKIPDKYKVVIPLLAVILTVYANYVASPSMYVVADGVVNDKVGAFFSWFENHEAFSEFFRIANQVGGGVTNLKSTLSLVLNKTIPWLENHLKYKKSFSPADCERFFKTQRLSTATLTSLSKLSIFKQSKTNTAQASIAPDAHLESGGYPVLHPHATTASSSPTSPPEFLNKL